MIDTIFYFANSLNDYNEKFLLGEINSRTITFIEGEKAIIKNNVMYGKMTDADIKLALSRILGDDRATLPIATTESLGVIKVGNYLNIDNLTGALSVDSISLFNNIPTASNSKTGGIKTNYTANGKNYPVLVDSNGNAYVNVNWEVQKGEKGDPGENGRDGVDGAKGSFKSRVFKRSATKPNTPTGGTYDNPIPSGWEDSIPSGNYAIWSSVCTFYGTGGSSGWSEPTQETDSKTLDLEFSPNVTQPELLPYGDAKDKDDFVVRQHRASQGWYDPSNLPENTVMVWRAERVIHNDIYEGDWVVTKILGERGPQGPAGNDATYDDSWLLDEIDSLNAGINAVNAIALNERNRLSSLINALDNQIKSNIESLLSNPEWFDEHFPDGGGANSNFGDEDVESYLQEIGVWARNGEGHITKALWSTLQLTVSQIRGTVELLVAGGSGEEGEDGISYDLLASTLYAYIHDHYTEAGMNSTWAKFMQLTNNDMLMLKWMSSGASSYADSLLTVASLFAAARDYDTNGVTLRLAASDINALVERDANDNLVAKSSMESMVNTAITGIINTATRSEAGTEIFSKINDNSNDIAAIVTKVTGDSSNATIATKLANMTAGLITEATLDNAVASLLTTSTLTKNSFNGAISTYATSAGLLTSSTLDGAMALLIASSGEVKFYCKEIVETGTSTFTAASGQTISVGTYYSASELSTICAPTTETQINNATAPFIITGTDNKLYKIIKVSATEGALGSSNLLAAITAGVKNDSSFIDMVANEVTISADNINLNGLTWAQLIHADEIVVDSLKDNDGNSVQVSYLVDKVEENSVYTAHVIASGFVGSYSNYGYSYHCYTEFGAGTPNTPGLYASNSSAKININCYSNYSVIGHMKVTMGGRDITGKYTTLNKNDIINGDVNQMNTVSILIPRVTGNIIVTIDGIDNITNTYISGLPVLINKAQMSSNVESLDCVFNTNEHETNNSTVSITTASNWAILDSISGNAISGASVTNSNNNLTVNIPNTISGDYVYLVGTTTINNTNISKQIKVVNNANLAGTCYIADFTLFSNNNVIDTANDYSGIYEAYAGVDMELIEHTSLNGSEVTVTFGYDQQDNENYHYDLYATINNLQGHFIFHPIKPGIVKVKMTVLIFEEILSGGSTTTHTFEAYRWIHINPKHFGEYNTTDDFYSDIFGRSDKDEQFVLNGSDLLKTKYIPYERYGLNGVNDINYVYLCESSINNHPVLSIDNTSGNAVPSWITNSEIVTKDGRNYLKFQVSEYTTALSQYNTPNITIDDQQNSRQCKIVVNSTDGSTFTLYITQSGKLGFYDVLKDNIHNCVSAKCLTPKYYWKDLYWYATGENDIVVRTDIYPDAIIIPTSGNWACKAISKYVTVTSNPKHSTTMGPVTDLSGLSPKMVYAI